MFQPPTHWFLAAALATLVVLIAYRLRGLSLSGAIAAVALGTVVVGTGGWWPGVILVVFFATSSVLSRSDNMQARGSRRDGVQVAANGWGILLGCVLYAISGWEPWLLFGIGAVAAATADTWSSELGPLSPSSPRLITSGRIVAHGTSGAITLYGTLASVAGSLLIASFAAVGFEIGSLATDSSAIIIVVGVTLSGIGGGLIDSVLGATVQEQRWCDSCKKTTEADPHRCGTATMHVGGIAGFNNDVVNILCVLTGALIALVSGIL